ncbi:MAG: MoaD/ThiS family protein [Myxococcales bacterium]|nr:MoaD/ThiS family protein [Myxococcales bacterium]
MPSVKVSFFGPVRRPWPETSRTLEAAAGERLGDLMSRLGYTPEEARRLALVVAGHRREPDFLLSDGDEVRVVLLAGGG